ncbi:hypothetical protein SY86_12365 [Erwinia tracheiphila]|uniref:Uncharacterized protein n=1 Tax=Erwinia tracheiphila TaxID=65700 RepID=A0A0M2KFQ7_9GAMM|nr:hypothetical protein AV903_15565 [Erwinia tracheiphila]EOS94855.1 hypothetical protein ETR_11439 [Erwinia tracheiphila PSU-1]KKF36038.1 hypothetical protein SY86_12365 [Erwinia tracheiphila]
MFISTDKKRQHSKMAVFYISKKDFITLRQTTPPGHEYHTAALIHIFSFFSNVFSVTVPADSFYSYCRSGVK